MALEVFVFLLYIIMALLFPGSTNILFAFKDTCPGSIFLSVFSVLFFWGAMKLFGPIINIIAASAAGMPVNPQKNRKMSSIVIPSMAVFAFVVLVMNSCGIWSILGIGGALVWFYTALALIGVILLAVVFLNM